MIHESETGGHVVCARIAPCHYCGCAAALMTVGGGTHTCMCHDCHRDLIRTAEIAEDRGLSLAFGLPPAPPSPSGDTQR